MDDKVKAQMEQWEREAKKRRAAAMKELSERFADAKKAMPELECVYIDYDGSGDEGSVTGEGSYINGFECELEVENVVELMEQLLPDGYQDNEGASGRLTFDGSVVRCQHQFREGASIPSPYVVTMDGEMVWAKTPKRPWKGQVVVEQRGVLTVEYAICNKTDNFTIAVTRSQETAEYIAWALNVMAEVDA